MTEKEAINIYEKAHFLHDQNDGQLKKAVNFELLRQMLSDVVPKGDEAYEESYLSKVKMICIDPPYNKGGAV